MINALGAEVDRLEADVAKLCPGIRHIDLVSHRVNHPPSGFMTHHRTLYLSRLSHRLLMRAPCLGTTAVGTSWTWYRSVGSGSRLPLCEFGPL